MSSIAQRRANTESEFNRLIVVIDSVLDQPLKRRTKTQMKEDFRSLALEIVNGAKLLANQLLTSSVAAEAKVATLEWYFNEKVEAHKQALLNKDKEIAELKQQLSDKLNVK